MFLFKNFNHIISYCSIILSLSKITLKKFTRNSYPNEQQPISVCNKLKSIDKRKQQQEAVMGTVMHKFIRLVKRLMDGNSCYKSENQFTFEAYNILILFRIVYAVVFF